MPKRLFLLTSALAALLLIAACGGRDEEPIPPPVATEATEAAAPAAPAVPTEAAQPTAAATEEAAQPESPLPPADAAQAESPLPEPNVLTGSAWELTSLDGGAPLEGSLTTIQFAPDGTVGGSDGCNRFAGAYTLDEAAGTIAFVPGLNTAMACDDAVMQQAARFSAALAGASSFTLEGDTLTVSGAGETLVFAPQRSDLAGTNWEIVSYNNGEGGVVTAMGEPALTLSFGADGTASGFGGCNTFTGAYTAPTIGQLAIGPLAATGKACAQPEGIMEQEQRYLAALAGAATYTVQGDFLDIRTADGAIAAQFFRAAPTE